MYTTKHVLWDVSGHGESFYDSVWIPLTLRRPGLVVVGAAAVARVAVGRRVLVVMMVSSVGQAGHVGVVQVDVGGLGGLAVGVVVAVVVVVVMGVKKEKHHVKVDVFIFLWESRRRRPTPAVAVELRWPLREMPASLRPQSAPHLDQDRDQPGGRVQVSSR